MELAVLSLADSSLPSPRPLLSEIRPPYRGPASNGPSLADSFPPYPPFRAPEDWRVRVVPEVDFESRNYHLAIQFVADTAADHALKHERHNHPWCASCDERADNLTGWREYQADILRDQLEQPMTAVKVNAIARDLAKKKDISELAETHGVDENDIYAVLEYREELLAWYAAPMQRALRWFIKNNGRPPVDDFDPGAGETSLSASLLDRDQLDALPSPSPLIEGVIIEHTYTLLAGRKSTYKSFVAIDWALSIATGLPWQGLETQQRRVLYLAAEGAYGVSQRVDAWEQLHKLDVAADTFTVAPQAVNLFTDSGTSELIDVVHKGGYGFVVLDTLNRVKGRATENSDEMSTVINNIEKVKRATEDGAVLVVAHTGKADGADSRGHSSIEDNADIIWYTRKNEESRFTITNIKMKDGNDGEEIKLYARWMGESLAIDKDAYVPGNANVTTGPQKSVITTMRDVFSETGATGTELLDTCGIPKATMYRAINELLKLGTLINAGTPSRKRYMLTAPTSDEG
jgi:hypothetical protein